MLFATALRRNRIAAVISVVLLGYFAALQLQLIPSWSRDRLGNGQPLIRHDEDRLGLPPEYQLFPEELAYCTERFGLQYLENLSKSAVNHCTANSAASVTCFHSRTAPDGRTDSFCIAGPAVFDGKEKKFSLGCRIREWTEKEVAQGIPKLDQFPHYWYQTGPRSILSKYVRIGEAERIQNSPSIPSRNFSILIQREEVISNPWHSLMQILSLFMTLDVLRMTRNPATNGPFFSTKDVENTQVLILF